MPHYRRSQTVRHTSNKISDKHHELKRKAHTPLALSTLYRNGYAPHSVINTSDSSADGSASISNSTFPDARLESGSSPNPIWPADGLNIRSHLTPEDAETLICKGVLCFRGRIYQASYTRQECPEYYALASTAKDDDPIVPSSKCPYGYQGLSLVLGGRPDPSRPWETLEQPSMTLCFGRIPGSNSINQYVSSTCEFPEDKRGPALITSKEMELRDVLDRLDCLQHGLDIDPLIAQEYLCNALVVCGEAQFKGPSDVTNQIHVLAASLDSPRWFDFRQPENQTTAFFFSNDNWKIVHIFYHQLMLSMQLLLNIQNSGFTSEQKIILLDELSEKVAWSVALAQLWEKHCYITKSIGGVYHPILRPYVMRPRKKSRIDQLERLQRFGHAMKWPRLSHVEKTIKEDQHGMILLENASKEIATYLSGLIMPGSCLSWMIMASLLDCDKEAARRLQSFTLFRPNFGFQCHGTSYWYWDCIVAKVMAAAPGVNQSTGWIGPVVSSANLSRSQCVLINQYAAPRRLGKQDTRTMEWRSQALGPEADCYPVKNFGLPSLDCAKIVTIKFQHLEFKQLRIDDKSGLTVYDSAAIFAVKGPDPRIIPIRMRYSVSFIDAPPCHSGPHVLFRDYGYEIAAVDKVLDLNFWGGGCICRLDCKGEKCKHRIKYPELFDEEKVMVVKTFGRKDNRVLARAWCSYMGLSAIVCDVQETCMACAIRAAYAAKAYVVIVF